MTINRLQAEFERNDNASIWQGVIGPDRHEKNENILFPLNNLSLNEWISLKFIWNMTINKILVEFEMDSYGYASIWPGVMTPDRHKNCKNLVSAQ